VPDGDAPDGWVDLSDAIAALRRDLAAAWQEGRSKKVRFKFEPVDLTVQAGVTRTGKGQAGVKWHILALGGEKSKEATVTQTLHLRLSPVFYGDDNKQLASDEQLASGWDDDPDAGESKD
jgi:Trypsin-co-occurring domain 2